MARISFKKHGGGLVSGLQVESCLFSGTNMVGLL